MLGGGSAINGQLANRGAPTDYDEWEARGATGWAWKDVLPYFNKVERDLDFDGPLHGKDGRIPVSRIPRDHWTGLSHAFGQACELAGHPFLPDQNGAFVEGYFPVTFNNQAERRVSAAMGYLDSDIRRRDQPGDPDQHARNNAAVRGYALRRRQGVGRRSGTGVSRPARSSSRAVPSIRRRISCAPASAPSSTSRRWAFRS